MHILITGATGLIGTALCQKLLDQGHRITAWIHTKSPHNPDITIVKRLDDIDLDDRIDAIINLAGASIAKRWSQSYQKTLLASRLDPTQALLKLAQNLKHKPATWINASAIGYYGDQDHVPLHENSKTCDGFTHQLCNQWEDLAQKAETLGIRVCLARFAVVLSPKGGALKEMLPAFKLGLGGPLGKGEQTFSWIHLDDATEALCFLLQTKQATGAFNLSSPNPISQKTFAKALGYILHRPAFLPTPAIVIKMLFGEMGDTLLLKGQCVLPDKLQKMGFQFAYPKIKKALASLIHTH